MTDGRAFAAKCTIVAPTAGVIDDRFVEPGEYIHEGAPAFRLVNADNVKIVVDVPEKDIGHVKLGQTMPFHVAGLGETSLTAGVTRVALAGNAQDNTFRVEASAANPSGFLRPGMIGDASVVRGVIEGAILVPLSSVIPQRGGYVAFVVRDGRAVRCTVRIGAFAAEEAMVSSGLSVGDELIVEGHRALEDGALVEARAQPLEDPSP